MNAALEKTGLPDASDFQLRLLGTFSLHICGQEIRGLSRANRWLLALLALHRSASLTREGLAVALWPDAETSRALFYLRRSLTELRAALGPERQRLVTPAPGALRLDLAAAWCDLRVFDSLIERNEEASLEQAVALYRGPFLEGCEEAWAVHEREARLERCLAALEALSGHRERDNDLPQAIVYLRRAIALDPLRETAHRRLMETLGEAGDYAGAEQQYRELRRLLHDALNLEPSAATKALYQCLKQQVQSRPLVPERTPLVFEPPFDNLPRPLSPLIGREQERAQIAERLQAARLLTLTGTGGIGKTRLAQTVALSQLTAFRHGVAWIELAALTGGEKVSEQIAATLRLSERKGETTQETLTDYLRSRQQLLVLDNCEHLLDACAGSVRALLNACPDLKILATSRQSLGLFGEALWRVSPLTVPQKTPLEDSGQGVLQSVQESDAAILFAARAQAVQSDFQLTEENAPFVAQICRKLDGIPLALELAAVWAGALSIQQIAARMNNQFALLQRGDRTAEARHQTLRSALDWSYDLLEPEERTLLARLAVFSGGWTLEAAEAVCGENASEARQTSLHLQSLRSKSLVEMGERNGAARYRLLEPVRQYAEERLHDAGVEQAMRARHFAYFLDLAEEIASILERTHSLDALDRMEADHDNLRAALTRCFAEPTEEANRRDGLRLAIALTTFRMLRGHYQEQQNALETALTRFSPEEDSALYAEGLQNAALIVNRRGDMKALEKYATEALALYRRRPPSSGFAAMLRNLGVVKMVQEDFTASKAFLEEGLAVSRRIGDACQEARCENVLGVYARLTGNHIEAQAHLEIAIRHFQSAGLLADEGVSQHGLANVFRELGDSARALPHYLRSLEIHRSLGSRAWMGINLKELSWIVYCEGDIAQARSLAEEALPLLRAGDRTIEPQCHVVLGEIARHEGDFTLARVYLREGVARCARQNQKRDLSYALLFVCFLLRDDGQTADASCLFSAVSRLRETMQAPFTQEDQPRVEALRQSCRDALGAEAFQAAWKAGEPMTLEEAVAYALERIALAT